MRIALLSMLGFRDLVKGGTPAPHRVRAAARSWWPGGLGLVLLCLAVYLPGQWSIPPVDRDESRFAMASWQMATSEGGAGDWIVPRIQDKPRLNKPPLIYWLQAGAWRLFGSEERINGGIWVFRLPSALAAVATALLTWRLGLRMFDPRAAWLGAALLAVCPVFVWEAHQARADQVLVLTVVATQFALWTIYHSRPRDTHRANPSFVAPTIFWLSLAAGVLVKGPITPMIAALTCLSLCLASRSWSLLLRLRPLLGLVILAAAVFPWVYLVAQRIGWSEYLRIIYDETIGRSAGAKEGHWGPPGYHTVLLGILFWPGSLLTALAIARACKRALRPPTQPLTAAAPSPSRLRRLLHSRPGRPTELFCLAWILPAWLVFEFISTKLPHYTMPMYPAIAMLSARAVLACAHARLHGPQGLGQRVGNAIWCTLGVLVVVLPVVLLSGLVPVVAWPTDLSRYTSPLVRATVATLRVASTGGALALLAVAIWIVRQRMYVRAQLLAVAVSVLALASFLGFWLPDQKEVWISSQIVGRIRALGGRPVAAVSYHEDSLIFLLRGRVRLLDREHWEEWTAAQQDPILIMPRDTAWNYDLRAGFGVFLPRLGVVQGFNYTKGRREILHICGAPE